MDQRSRGHLLTKPSQTERKEQLKLIEHKMPNRLFFWHWTTRRHTQQARKHEDVMRKKNIYITTMPNTAWVFVFLYVLHVLMSSNGLAQPLVAMHLTHTASISSTHREPGCKGKSSSANLKWRPSSQVLSSMITKRKCIKQRDSVCFSFFFCRNKESCNSAVGSRCKAKENPSQFKIVLWGWKY